MLKVAWCRYNRQGRSYHTGVCVSVLSHRLMLTGWCCESGKCWYLTCTSRSRVYAPLLWRWLCQCVQTGRRRAKHVTHDTCYEYIRTGTEVSHQVFGTAYSAGYHRYSCMIFWYYTAVSILSQYINNNHRCNHRQGPTRTRTPQTHKSSHVGQ